jgi:WD40 repeat protein
VSLERLPFTIANSFKSHAVAFSPDGKYLTSATKTSAIRIWDIATDGEHMLQDATSETIRHIAFSPWSTLPQPQRGAAGSSGSVSAGTARCRAAPLARA